MANKAGETDTFKLGVESRFDNLKIIEGLADFGGNLFTLSEINNLY